MSTPLKRSFPEVDFGGFTHCDGAIQFYSRINALAEPGFVVLDYGCGRGFYDKHYKEDRTAFRRNLQVLRGKVAKVIGVDRDPGAKDNPFIDEFRLLTDDKVPLPDASIDLCVCDWVLEHMVDPAHFFREIARLLRPGGYMCARTPNKWHYVGIGASLVPNRLHDALLKKLETSHESEYVFDTFYRCNTHLRDESGDEAGRFLTRWCMTFETEPTYFVQRPFLFRLGMLTKNAPVFSATRSRRLDA